MSNNLQFINHSTEKISNYDKKRRKRERILKVLQAFEIINKRKNKKRRTKSVLKAWDHLQYLIQDMGDQDVQRYLRMTIKTFRKLGATLMKFMRKPWRARGSSFYRYVSLDVRVVLTLQTLAECDVADLQTAFCIPRSTI